MEHIKPLQKRDALQLIRRRKGETRVGEMANYTETGKTLKENLKNIAAQFVLLGIPEDIGVRANYGRGGAQTAWKPALENILSIQSNSYFEGKELLILGEVEVEDLLLKTKNLSQKNTDDLKELRLITEEIDDRVFPVVKEIIAAGKTPIVIGGGHNNAYGLLKGTSEGLMKRSGNKNLSVNAINCDAHADLRPLEGRHSGNGFSYAIKNKYLSKYAAVGIHENYLTQDAHLTFLNNPGSLLLRTYEDIFVRGKISFEKTLSEAFSFLKGNPCGIELDLDAITNVPSSAKTSSGISPVQARQYAYQCGKKLPCAYFHIAEGAPVLAHLKADNKTGKLIGYLVTDFIKGFLERNGK